MKQYKGPAIPLGAAGNSLDFPFIPSAKYYDVQDGIPNFFHTLNEKRAKEIESLALLSQAGSLSLKLS